MVTSLNRVVIVEHDDELLAIVESALERDGASMAGLPEYFRTITEAKSQLRPLAAAPKPDLVMVDEAIPLTSSTAGGVSGQGGRKFAEWLVREQVSSRVLLMKSAVAAAGSDFRGRATARPNVP